jgi:hypothetical protein
VVEIEIAQLTPLNLQTGWRRVRVLEDDSLVVNAVSREFTAYYEHSDESTTFEKSWVVVDGEDGNRLHTIESIYTDGTLVSIESLTLDDIYDDSEEAFRWARLNAMMDLTDFIGLIGFTPGPEDPPVEFALFPSEDLYPAEDLLPQGIPD